MRSINLALLTVAGIALAGCANPDEPVITIPVTIPAAHLIDDGTHEVLADVKAGRYRTEGPRPGESCFWYRLNGTGGTQVEIIATGMIHGPATVTIRPGDKAFRTEFCQPWERIGDTP